MFHGFCGIEKRCAPKSRLEQELPIRRQMVRVLRDKIALVGEGMEFRLVPSANPPYSDKFKMRRWVCFLACAVFGLVMVACGVLVPAHLRAVSDAVVQKAGVKTPTAVGEGLELVREEKSGPAQMLLQTAQDEQLRDRDKLGFAIGNLTVKRPATLIWGGPEPRLEKVFGTGAARSTSGSEPFTRFLVRLENREKALQILAASQNPVVSTLLRSRFLTNTVLFSPSLSSSGQAFDTAVAVVGLLLEEGQLTKGMSDTILALAAEANRGGNPQRLEQVLLDFMSLGQRFNYEQLVAFTGRIDDAETLRLLTDQARQADRRLPRLFAVVQMSGRPADVAKYLIHFKPNRTDRSRLQPALRRRWRNRTSAAQPTPLPAVVSDVC